MYWNENETALFLVTCTGSVYFEIRVYFELLVAKDYPHHMSFNKPTFDFHY